MKKKQNYSSIHLRWLWLKRNTWRVIQVATLIEIWLSNFSSFLFFTREVSPSGRLTRVIRCLTMYPRLTPLLSHYQKLIRAKSEVRRWINFERVRQRRVSCVYRWWNSRSRKKWKGTNWLTTTRLPIGMGGCCCSWWGWWRMRRLHNSQVKGTRRRENI